MSQLLKNIWRNALKSNSLNMIMSRSLSSSIAELPLAKPTDAIMSRIKSASSTHDVLATIQLDLPKMTHKHMLQALRSLFELQKTTRYDSETCSLVKDPTFSVLCQNFKKHARSLDVSEAIEATKVLSYLKVPVDSLIVQTMLQMIRCNINDINIRQIIFLDFLLRKFDSKNHLVDALKLALPLAFQIHLSFELDNEDVPFLKSVLAYSCARDLPDRSINNIVTCLLLHDQAIDAETAKSVIWSLCQINCTEQTFPTRMQLLHVCYDILSQSLDQLTYDDVLRTAAKIKGRILEKHPEFYHEQLMDKIAEYVVKNKVEFEKGLLVARILSRIAHTHLGLIQYLCDEAASSPDTLSNARTNILFGFINCLSNSNYTPEPSIWSELRRQISENPVLKATNSALPWTKMCLELAALGHYEDKVLERIFSKEFLDDYLARENNTLDYLQLLTLQEAVACFHSEEYKLPEEVMKKAKEMYPVQAMNEQIEHSLSQGLGGPEYVVRNVVLPSGIVADMVMYINAGSPVKLPRLSSNEKLPLERLNLPSGGIVVCLMNFHQGCFSMNSNRLRGTFRLILDIIESQGYAAVPICISEWFNAPPHEKTAYLLREVNYKCAEMGMKLTAT